MLKKIWLTDVFRRILWNRFGFHIVDVLKIILINNFRKPQIRSSELFAAMADGIRYEVLRTVQIQLHNAHQNKTIQRGKSNTSPRPASRWHWESLVYISSTYIICFNFIGSHNYLLTNRTYMSMLTTGWPSFGASFIITWVISTIFATVLLY